MATSELTTMASSSTPVPGKLTQLFIYPVKSLAGVEVDEVRVTAKGLEGDREWMLVNEAGRFVTQRQIPKLATVQVALSESGLKLSHSTAGTLTVPSPAPDAPQLAVTVWRDECLALKADSAVSAWLAEALGDAQIEPLRLVKFAPAFTRASQPERFGDATTHFADAAPFLITNQRSLNALNLHLQQQHLDPVEMLRFRPNLVADGLPAFAEQKLTHLDVGSFSWRLCDPCQRCAIITVDPETGERTPQIVPFKQLTAVNPMPNNPKAPAFGMNARLVSGAGRILRKGADAVWH